MRRQPVLNLFCLSVSLNRRHDNSKASPPISFKLSMQSLIPNFKGKKILIFSPESDLKVKVESFLLAYSVHSNKAIESSHRVNYLSLWVKVTS